MIILTKRSLTSTIIVLSIKVKSLFTEKLVIVDNAIINLSHERTYLKFVFVKQVRKTIISTLRLCSKLTSPVLKCSGKSIFESIEDIIYLYALH